MISSQNSHVFDSGTLHLGKKTNSLNLEGEDALTVHNVVVFYLFSTGKTSNGMDDKTVQLGFLRPKFDPQINGPMLRKPMKDTECYLFILRARNRQLPNVGFWLTVHSSPLNDCLISFSLIFWQFYLINFLSTLTRSNYSRTFSQTELTIFGI